MIRTEPLLGAEEIKKISGWLSKIKEFLQYTWQQVQAKINQLKETVQSLVEFLREYPPDKLDHSLRLLPEKCERFLRNFSKETKNALERSINDVLHYLGQLMVRYRIALN